MPGTKVQFEYEPAAIILVNRNLRIELTSENQIGHCETGILLSHRQVWQEDPFLDELMDMINVQFFAHGETCLYDPKVDKILIADGSEFPAFLRWREPLRLLIVGEPVEIELDIFELSSLFDHHK